MSENDLIRLLKKGDRQAFNELVSQYQNKVINIAYGLLSNQEDALDAAQDVFIKVFKSIDSFNGNSLLSTWIYRITANVCKDYLRKRQRRVSAISLHKTNDDNDSVIDIPDETLNPENTVQKTELQNEITKAINSLSDEYKTVLTLSDIEGLSYDKISEILKIPNGTVKSRLFRARAALKKKILENRELFF